MVKMFHPTCFSFLLLSVLLLGMMSTVCPCEDYGPKCGQNDFCECDNHVCCTLSEAKSKQCMTGSSCRVAQSVREAIQTRDKFISALYGREEQ